MLKSGDGSIPILRLSPQGDPRALLLGWNEERLDLGVIKFFELRVVEV